MIASIRECIKSMKKILDERLYMNYPLAPLTSLKMGGQAELYAIVYDVEELRKIVTLAMSEGMKTRILGKGTNLVIQNGLLNGIVIRLSGTLKEIKRSKNRIGMGGGCPLSFLLKEAITFNLDGAEVLAGIPGTLGGAVIMNAGTNQGSLGDMIEEVDILTQGKIKTCRAKDIGFSYRGSGIKNGEIVIGARLKLNSGVDVKEDIKKSLQKRRLTQPYRERSAGCIFKNPEEDLSAGKLIDETGLKGFRKGQIEVSKKHANFFINLGGGIFDDFVCLMDIVQKRVYQKFRIELRPEVNIWVNEDEK